MGQNEHIRIAFLHNLEQDFITTATKYLQSLSPFGGPSPTLSDLIDNLEQLFERNGVEVPFDRDISRFSRFSRLLGVACCRFLSKPLIFAPWPSCLRQGMRQALVTDPMPGYSV